MRTYDVRFTIEVDDQCEIEYVDIWAQIHYKLGDTDCTFSEFLNKIEVVELVDCPLSDEDLDWLEGHQLAEACQWDRCPICKKRDELFSRLIDGGCDNEYCGQFMFNTNIGGS